MKEKDKYKFDNDGARYLDKQYWDRSECLHYTDAKSIDRHALPTLGKEFRSDIYPEWKYNSKFKPYKKYDLTKIVFRVRIRQNDEGEIIDNFIEPCIVHKDSRSCFDQYFVESVSSSLWNLILIKKPEWKHIDLPYSNEDTLTRLEKRASDGMYVVADPLYPSDEKVSTFTKVFGNYEMANSYRYNKEIAFNINKDEKEYDEIAKESVDVCYGKTVITLSEIAKAFNCSKDKIILDLSK